MIDVSKEIKFQTARSGGKGGQNVNKVETMVEGYFPVAASQFFSGEQKSIICVKLSARINAEGFLLVKSQQHRTQLQNKAEVVRKINELLRLALQKAKKRIPTKISRSSKEKRLQGKKQASFIKEGRRKIGKDGF